MRTAADSTNNTSKIRKRKIDGLGDDVRLYAICNAEQDTGCNNYGGCNGPIAYFK